MCQPSSRNSIGELNPSVFKIISYKIKLSNIHVFPYKTVIEFSLLGQHPCSEKTETPQHNMLRGINKPDRSFRTISPLK